MLTIRWGKKTSVFELIKGACKENLLPVGKLDKNHSGLLLFTNDDKLSRKLSHPEHEMKKIYHISLDKTLKSIDLKKIKDTLFKDNLTLENFDWSLYSYFGVS